MKKYLVLLASLVFLGCLTSGAFAYTVDGSLADWGVTPFSDWTPNSGTANWSGNQNYTGSGYYPNGGESFDAEAMYFDNDANNLYVALVVSMAPTGSYYSPLNLTLMPGDLGLDITPAYADGSKYEYGFGIHSFAGQLLAVTDWSLPDGNHGIPANGPSTIVSGNFLGNGSLAYVDAGALEGIDPKMGNTYIIEMSIPKNLFGVALADGQIVNAHWTMTCGNDVLNVSGTMDGNAVPEPVTLLLLSGGLLGIAGFRKRN